MAYSFVSINFPGATKTEALGLNENGKIVGLYTDPTGVTHGFLDQNNVFTTIDDPLGTNSTQFGNSVATGVNNPGEIVGYYFDSTGLAHGFLDNEGIFATLDSPIGTKGTFPQDIAENGRIVGHYLDNSGKAHGFLDDKGSFTTVDFTASGIQAGSVQTFAQGINNPGQIVGYYLDSNNKAHGFLDDKGTFTTIDDPSAVNGTFVEGIAENKLIVGYYLDANSHAHGFVDDRGTFTTVDDPSGTETFLQGINNQGLLTGFYVDGSGVRHGLEASPPIAVFDTDTDQTVAGAEEAYSGPVARLQHQFISSDQDSVNISVSDDNWFLHGGPGDDAIQAHGGYNVLDGGTGSNFLTGGTGTDTFFVDDRNPSADIWSTLNGFHSGDDATVFGSFTFNDVQTSDNEGAAGFTGLTMHITKTGEPTASLTLPGFSTSDLNNGRLSMQFGSEQDGTAFMHIIAS